MFSCPPYADLEVYSEAANDLSHVAREQGYEAFLETYRAAIAAACARLKPDRFAALVVGDMRDKSGVFRGFVGDTVEAFRAAGLGLYNEAILVTAAGSEASAHFSARIRACNCEIFVTITSSTYARSVAASTRSDRGLPLRHVE